MNGLGEFILGAVIVGVVFAVFWTVVENLFRRLLDTTLGVKEAHKPIAGAISLTLMGVLDLVFAALFEEFGFGMGLIATLLRICSIFEFVVAGVFLAIGIIKYVKEDDNNGHVNTVHAIVISSIPQGNGYSVTFRMKTGNTVTLPTPLSNYKLGDKGMLSWQGKRILSFIPEQKVVPANPPKPAVKKEIPAVSGPQVFCSSCGLKQSYGDGKCSACGKELMKPEEEEQRYIFCYKCGQKLIVGAKHCNACGTQMKN